MNYSFGFGADVGVGFDHGREDVDKPIGLKLLSVKSRC